MARVRVTRLTIGQRLDAQTAGVRVQVAWSDLRDMYAEVIA